MIGSKRPWLRRKPKPKKRRLSRVSSWISRKISNRFNRKRPAQSDPFPRGRGFILGNVRRWNLLVKKHVDPVKSVLLDIRVCRTRKGCQAGSDAIEAGGCLCVRKNHPDSRVVR